MTDVCKIGSKVLLSRIQHENIILRIPFDI